MKLNDISVLTVMYHSCLRVASLFILLVTGCSSVCMCCSNVIDVAQLESQQMEQHEYMDRARQYRSVLWFS